MTWSYSGNPKDNNKDAVRFLVGDTDSDEELIQDEEILFILDTETNIYRAAANVAESIAAMFSRKADVSIGDYSESLSQQADNYLKLAERLRKTARKNIQFKGIPFAGGISKTDKEITQKDTDRVKPAFKRNLQNHPTTK